MFGDINRERTLELFGTVAPHHRRAPDFVFKGLDQAGSASLGKALLDNAYNMSPARPPFIPTSDIDRYESLNGTTKGGRNGETQANSLRP